MLNRLAVLIVLTLSAYARAQSAIQLNAQGFAQYRKQQYQAAIASFQKAKAADSKHALSRYNLAATLALMRQKGQTCQFEASLDSVFENLNESIRLDSRRKARALVDRDFMSVARTFQWQRLLGRTLPKDFRSILTSVDWYSAGEGVYGSLHSLAFMSNGTFNWNRLSPTDDGQLSKSTTVGKWTLSSDNSSIELTLSRESIVGKLSAAGELSFDRQIPTLTEAKSECEG